MISDFPDISNKNLYRVDDSAEKELEILFELIGEIRRIRSELRINPGVRVKVNIKPASNKVRSLIAKNSEYMLGLAKLENLMLEEPAEKKGFVKTVKSDSVIYINLIDAIDIDLEIRRIEDEISKEKLKKEKSDRKISNPQFIKKAPEDVINKEKMKLEEANNSIENLQEQLNLIRSLKP
jgi:valyl-tRNA synthetase